jgi:hypothetical protein
MTSIGFPRLCSFTFNSFRQAHKLVKNTRAKSYCVLSDCGRCSTFLPKAILFQSHAWHVCQAHEPLNQQTLLYTSKPQYTESTSFISNLSFNLKQAKQLINPYILNCNYILYDTENIYHTVILVGTERGNGTMDDRRVLWIMLKPDSLLEPG